MEMTLDKIVFEEIVSKNINNLSLKFGNRNRIDVSNFDGELQFDVSFPLEFEINKNFYSMGDHVIDLEDSRSIVFFSRTEKIVPSLDIQIINIKSITFHYVNHVSYENRVCYKLSFSYNLNFHKYNFFLFFNLFMPSIVFSYFDFNIQGDCQAILYPSESEELDEGYDTEDVVYEFIDGVYKAV